MNTVPGLKELMGIFESIAGSETCSSFALMTLRAFGALLFLPLEGWLAGNFSRLSVAVVLALGLWRSDIVPMLFSAEAALCELTLGALLGLPLFLVLEVFGMSGALFDLMRGQSIAESYAPQLSEGGSSTEALLRRLVLSAICAYGALENLMLSLKRSLSAFPPGFDPSLLYGSEKLFEAAGLLSAGLSAFLPLAALFLTLELALGLAARFLPGFNFNSEGLLLKSVLGTLACLSLWALSAGEVFSDLAQTSGAQP